MTEKTIKWLKRYPDWKVAIANLERQYQYRKETGDRVSAIPTTKIRSGKTHKVYNIPEETVLSLEEILERKAEIEVKVQIIESAMELLDETQRKVIELKYFKRYRGWQVAQAIGFTERQCRNIRTEAVQILHKAMFGE
jgi:RNA polymerase sigma factor (sigma-70 family)